MIILTLRTDKPEAEIGLFNDATKLAYVSWQAHRQLAETLHTKIDELLTQQQKTWHDVQGIVMYEGPGSFTGLRIGLSVGNALAYSNDIVATGAGGDDWIQEGLAKLRTGNIKRQPVLPVYGSDAHITPPRA
jgi:tRNA threonylcarbamoyladenosine biosynthesis protein TsaB